MNRQIIRQAQPTMYFIGVTTAKSSIMRVFPLWMKELGKPEVVIQGWDLRLHDDPENYRQAVLQIKKDALSLGALVTSHKITLFQAARDLFDGFDSYAEICGEVSGISKNNGCLEGYAKDPITAGLSLDALLGPQYFARTGGDVLCFGGGGSATAILLHLAHKANPGDRPRNFVVVNRSEPRLAALRQMTATLNTDIRLQCYCQTDTSQNDTQMEAMPDGSLIINATGMGKDLPGSPISNRAVFPENSIAWELNYRGELDFLHQALAQQRERSLIVEDGWLYFLHGWTQVISEVLKVNVGGPIFDRLAAIAAEICTPALPPRQYAQTSFEG
jgi:shikimate 5-dehydrogenase